MGKVISVIATALPVFIALAMGMMCRSRQFITRDGVDTLKKVIINLTLPFVLFSSFATAEYSLSSLILPIVVFAVCTLLLMLGFLIIRLSKMQSRLAPFLASGFEAGMLGFALFGLLFPDESMSKFAMIVLGQEIFVFTLYKMLLTKKTDPKAILDDLLHSPTLIAVILGLLVSVRPVSSFASRRRHSSGLSSNSNLPPMPIHLSLLISFFFLTRWSIRTSFPRVI